jgi:hypothetical protein
MFLVGRIGAELIGVISDIDRPIGTEPERLFQNRGHDVDGAELSAT